MIAYNREKIDALNILSYAKKWQKKNLISKDRLQIIEAKYKTGFYSPNLFIRIALFLFTVFLSSCAIGLGSLFFYLPLSGLFNNPVAIGYILIFYGCAFFYILELFIRGNHYRSGIDDALLYIALSQLITGLVLVFNFSGSLLTILMISLPVLIASAIRYADRLVTFISYACFLAIIVTGLIRFPGGKLMLPFFIMGISAGIYFLLERSERNYSFRFWIGCRNCLKVFSLLSFYLAGNYFVIREGNAALTNDNTAYVPLGFLFLIFTLLIPAAYIAWGLKKKDRLLLNAGMILVAAGILTYKYYFSLASAETSLMVAGIALIIIARLTIAYLKANKKDFSFEIDEESNNDAEALIIAQTLSSQAQTNADEINYGGGDFGGAGSGDKF